MPIVEVDGLITHYEECGEGTSIVLVHGAQGTVEGFDGMVRVLKEKYRVITPSLPGRSGSENLSGDVTIEHYANHIAYLLTKIDVKKAVLAGSSMGGLVCLSFCYDHPEMTLALVLIDSGAKIPIDERILKLFEDDCEGTTRMAASMGYSKNTPKNVVEDALKYNLDVPKETVLRDFGATSRFDATDRLHRIKVPTLITMGSDDILTPKPMADTLNKGIKGSVVEIIKGAGHSSVVEKPRELSVAIMRFLQRHNI
ncbi:MAG: alpha/beta hydrolase [Candidatus Atabeyarchaeum deiterrae]